MLRLQNDLKFYYGMYAACMCDLVMLLQYSQMFCLLVYIICVCVKVVGNVVKDVGIGISLTATQVKELYF